MEIATSSLRSGPLADMRVNYTRRLRKKNSRALNLASKSHSWFKLPLRRGEMRVR